MNPSPKRRSSEREREMNDDRVSRAIGAVILIAAPFVGGMAAFYNSHDATRGAEIGRAVETPAASATMEPGNPDGLDLHGDLPPSLIIPQEYRGIDSSPYNGGFGPGTDGRNGYRNGLSPRGQLEDANRKLGTPSK